MAMPVGAFDAALTNNDATSVPLSDIPETFPRILAATDTHCRDCSRELPALRKSDLSFERTLVLRDGSQSTIQVWTRGKCTHCGLGHQPTYWNREEEERPVANDTAVPTWHRQHNDVCEVCDEGELGGQEISQPQALPCERVRARACMEEQNEGRAGQTQTHTRQLAY